MGDKEKTKAKDEGRQIQIPKEPGPPANDMTLFHRKLKKKKKKKPGVLTGVPDNEGNLVVIDALRLQNICPHPV